ncbi:glutaredoxin [Paracoccus sp. 1_MG-2023]|uniref:glutaredoxin family protein n=1 Tax=unclassified Paracoccus (in: a-proteobacteria) TaxID=2688777 RepID=UPI001C09AC9C|nr:MULTISPECIES: glutaredoxin [unclassified Paracoccus (in: a-proteobacteria)]MBU2956382.1 glutaredoxin [Paracoccus sp. C2R09]MDO6669884.1 glutaredoxin [Paracoccus sp. 1_MG-2023]
MPTTAKARLYRMMMPDHKCPYGQKSRSLLRRYGLPVEDHLLTTREEVDEFKRLEGVETTPQTWIGEDRIGGYAELRAYFGKPLPDPDATTYRPVIAIFGVALLMAAAVTILTEGPAWATIPRFAAIAMVLLGLQKLQDVESFSTMFLNYDLMAQRAVPYAYAYPWLETGTGILMIAGVFPWLSGPVAMFIGGVGAYSVWKAVWVEKRELKCACVGGGSNVPLGFVSMTENLVMLAMGIFTIVAAI